MSVYQLPGPHDLFQSFFNDKWDKLWERIKHKTRYRVEYATDELIRKAAAAVSAVKISVARLVTRKAKLNIDGSGIEGVVVRETMHDLNEQCTVPDVLGYIQNKTKLTRDTILRIILAADKIDDILINPQLFMDLVSQAILKTLHEMMVDGIKYEKIAGQYWDQRLFDNDELESYLDNLVKVQKQDKTLYNYVQVDSDIERRFVSELENRQDVKFYFKLPFWFKIQTPIGEYNPDWAIVFEGDKRIYFVAETKGTTAEEDLSIPEQYKIRCGRAHFKALPDVTFKAPIRNVSELIR